jgi:Uma2 family endonuclease
MTIQLEHRLLTVNEDQQMAAAGILGEDDRVELLNGQLIKTSPSGSTHAAYVEKISEQLKLLLHNKAMVRAQNSIVLGQYSEPEPDVAVVFRKDNYYADHHPIPAEIFFLIEVADTSLEKDRQIKGAIYAAAQIQEYWIVNLDKREMEVYQKPVEGQYQVSRIYTINDEILIPLIEKPVFVKSLIL